MPVYGSLLSLFDTEIVDNQHLQKSTLLCDTAIMFIIKM